MSGRIIPARARQAFHTSARLLDRSSNSKLFGYRTAERAEEGKRRERYRDAETGGREQKTGKDPLNVSALLLALVVTESITYILFGPREESGKKQEQRQKQREEEKKKEKEKEKAAPSERLQGWEQDGGGGAAA